MWSDDPKAGFRRVVRPAVWSSLSGADLARLREWIATLHDPAECLARIEAAARGRPYPHCGCTRTDRCGFDSGLQRFRCFGCRRTFNALAGTLLSRLSKRECWLPDLHCMIESRTCVIPPAPLASTGRRAFAGATVSRLCCECSAQHAVGHRRGRRNLTLESQKGSRDRTARYSLFISITGPYAMLLQACLRPAWYNAARIRDHKHV